MARRPDGKLTFELYDGEYLPQDECGVFGVWAPGEEVAKLTFYGLYALQHRGQESAGIATSDGERIFVYKDMGLVSQVFTESDLATLTGNLAIGHCRYSTTVLQLGTTPNQHFVQPATAPWHLPTTAI